jgi:hypothetical protein
MGLLRFLSFGIARGWIKRVVRLSHYTKTKNVDTTS